MLLPSAVLMRTGELVNRRAAREWKNRWATAIHAHRTEVLHMSQTQFAGHVGVSQSTVAMWESAKSVPQDLMKVRLIALAGLDARHMFRPLEADPIGKDMK